MSVQGTEGESETVVLPTELDATFASVMDILAPAIDSAAAGEGGAPAGAPATGGGQSAAPAPVAGGTAGSAGAGATGADGKPVVAAEGGADAAAAGAADGTGSAAVPEGVDFETIKGEFGKISTALETTATELHQGAALEEVKKDYPKYFEAIQVHPRMLIGTQVPSLKGDGTEVLRDSQDAKDWQEAVKSLLAGEVRERATQLAEEDDDMLAVVHQSIELFQNNADLVPGTKQFDKELADRFVELVKPYEVRVDGKLNGYSIQVQPLIEQVRNQLKASRAAATPIPPAATAAAGAAGGAPASAAPAAGVSTQAPAPGPQAGIPAKAGASTEQDDFSILFGSIGLPNMRI